MNLIIDVGNTAIKLAVFRSEKLVYDEVIEKGSLIEKVKQVFAIYPNIGSAIVSSVGEFDNKEFAALSIFCKVQYVDFETKIPFKNSYATPQTLGVDRIALATAAFYHNPNSNILVIDAGHLYHL